MIEENRDGRPAPYFNVPKGGEEEVGGVKDADEVFWGGSLEDAPNNEKEWGNILAGHELGDGGPDTRGSSGNDDPEEDRRNEESAKEKGLP